MQRHSKPDATWSVLQRMVGLSLLVVAISVAVAALIHAPATADNATTDPVIASVQETGKAFATVTKQVAPAVVFIQATKQTVAASMPHDFGGMQGQIPDEMLRRFFGDRMPEMRSPRQPQPSMGAGSGFIISKEGYILTNNHVVGNASTLQVSLQDGRNFEAKLVGTDAHTDVAIIKIDADDLPALSLGDSDSIEVGEWVLAVGSPFGLSGTVTAGIISAKERNSMGITDYENFLQTDAAINPGNSGGPLINLKGEVVGINTAIMSRSGGYNGIGFAIPINMAKAISQQLMEDGSVTRGYLGVIIQQLTPSLAQSFGIDGESGVLVGEVAADGPAARGKIKQGDVILEMDGKAVENLTRFRNRVAMVKPDTQIKLVVLRDGSRKTLTIKAGTLPGDQSVAQSQPGTIDPLGLSVQTLDEQLANELGVKDESGVVVTRVAPGSDAARQGIRPGMLIKEVNRKPVDSVKDMTDAIAANPDGESVLLLVQAGERSRYVVLKLQS